MCGVSSTGGANILFGRFVRPHRAHAAFLRVVVPRRQVWSPTGCRLAGVWVAARARGYSVEDG